MNIWFIELEGGPNILFLSKLLSQVIGTNKNNVNNKVKNYQ
jgi:hypothetical protein